MSRSFVLGWILLFAGGLAVPAHAQRDEGAFCRIIIPGPPPRLSRAHLVEMLEDTRSSLGGCIAYDGLRSAEVTVRVDEEHVVTATARTRPHRDVLAEECVAGNARDRVVRMVEPYDVSRPLRARLRIVREE